MGKRPCKAGIELRAVGDTVFRYSEITRDAEEWKIKSREVVYVDDRLTSVKYTLSARLPSDPAREEIMPNVTENELFDTAKDAVLPHLDDMRQIIENCAVQIKFATDTLTRWMSKYAIGGNQ